MFCGFKYTGVQYLATNYMHWYLKARKAKEGILLIYI